MIRPRNRTPSASSPAARITAMISTVVDQTIVRAGGQSRSQRQIARSLLAHCDHTERRRRPSDGVRLCICTRPASPEGPIASHLARSETDVVYGAGPAFAWARVRGQRGRRDPSSDGGSEIGRPETGGGCWFEVITATWREPWPWRLHRGTARSQRPRSASTAQASAKTVSRLRPVQTGRQTTRGGRRIID
jgi:hypothetical protein